MSDYRVLRVKQVIEETADARSLVFDVPAELAEQFRYQPGQFLTLRVPHDEGWLHTGDVGSLDEAGNLRITDRLKDMFIVGGFNCYPAEIEAGLLEHPAIAQVAVIGVPDSRMGEVGCACVVRRVGAQLDEAELIAWSRERMANYKVPRFVHFLDALPLNPSNKVDKNRLRAAVAVG